MIELAEERQENSKTFKLDDGRRQIRVSIGAIHYKENYASKSEQWKDINLAWEGDHITKAPYELTLNEQEVTLRDKKTGRVSTIELLESTNITGWKIIPEYTRVKFRHKIDILPFEARFKVAGTIPFRTRAYDEVGEIDLVVTLENDILTERLDSVIDSLSGKTRSPQGSIKVDPTWDPGANEDDCVNVPGKPYFAITPWYYSAGYSGSSYPDAGSACRFLNVTIPPGSIIVSAHLSLTGYANLALTAVNTRIRAERNINPIVFSDVTDFNGRTWTTEYVNWDGIDGWTIDTEYTSDDFKDCIQEVIDLENWASGNPMVILWDDFEKRSTQENARQRQAFSYDGDSGKAEQLVITFTPPEIVGPFPTHFVIR